MSRPWRKRFDSEGTLSPNLTPLLDIVLQLITFFMMLIHFGSQVEGESKLIRLPVTSAALPGADLGLDRLVVSVDATGKLLAEGSSFDELSVIPWWTQQAARRRAGLNAMGKSPDVELPTVVVIRADKDASYGAVRRVLVAAQEQGFANFTLIVLRNAKP
jgi:biopolymer transport protein ExbD